MASKRGKNDVHIIEVDGEFRVRPAVISVGDDYKLSIRSYADCPALLRFPGMLGVFINNAQVEYHVLPARGTVELKFGDPPNTPRPNADVYSYQADMLKPGLDPIPARGESGPRIIVDP